MHCCLLSILFESLGKLQGNVVTHIRIVENSHGGMCNQFLLHQQYSENIILSILFTFRDLETFLNRVQIKTCYSKF